MIPTPFDQDMMPDPWCLPSTPPLLAAESERTPSDVEKTVEHVLGDLKGIQIGRGTAERIRDAAADRVKKVNTEENIHRAIRR